MARTQTHHLLGAPSDGPGLGKQRHQVRVLVRQDPQAPTAYGASITYDLPVGEMDRETYQAIDDDLRPAPVPIAV